MKPPFKACDLCTVVFDMSTVCFVASLSCINMTLNLSYVMPTCAISGL